MVLIQKGGMLRSVERSFSCKKKKYGQDWTKLERVFAMHIHWSRGRILVVSLTITLPICNCWWQLLSAAAWSPTLRAAIHHLKPSSFFLFLLKPNLLKLIKTLRNNDRIEPLHLRGFEQAVENSVSSYREHCFKYPMLVGNKMCKKKYSYKACAGSIHRCIADYLIYCRSYPEFKTN